MTVSQDKETCLARNTLVVFARAPQSGKVKTRLAKSVGDEAARAIYVAMLRDVFAYAQTVVSQIADAEVVVFYTPDNAFFRGEDSLRAFWDGAHHPQSDGDLGDKIFNCFQHLRENGAQKIVVIGTDAPDLPPHFLVDAFRALEVHDLVFGASVDGGFYSVGVSCDVARDVFKDVRWSSENTLDDVLSNVGGKLIHFLPLWRDVDTIDDLRELEKRLRNGESHALQICRVLDVWIRNDKEPQA